MKTLTCYDSEWAISHVHPCYTLCEQPWLKLETDAYELEWIGEMKSPADIFTILPNLCISCVIPRVSFTKRKPNHALNILLHYDTQLYKFSHVCYNSVSSSTWTLKVYPFMVYSLIVWTSWTCNICINKWATLSVFPLLSLLWRGTYSSSSSCCLVLDSLANCCSLLCFAAPIFANLRKNAVCSKLVFKFETGIL